MEKPVIGILPQFDRRFDREFIGDDYIVAVEGAGGQVKLLHITEDEAEMDAQIAECDGFLIPGGRDIDPVLYGAKVAPYSAPIQHFRDVYTLAMINRIRKADKPLLGICYGMQAINVAYGGTLIQDIRIECPFINTPHDRKLGLSKESAIHDVTLVEGLPLQTLLDLPYTGAHGFHHQAIKTVGEGLAVMGRSADKLVEAFYDPEKTFIWGVMWHPESDYTYRRDSQLVFNNFIDHCR
ncbi:MAG: gamma-glutamyl-gamma-aminobutyrate hydrolase family protein [Solobacterium sp.]|nr:gamma-glutamyl-gamma-aminobutyrate hydrolase family protein [Solobacterium sp.]